MKTDPDVQQVLQNGDNPELASRLKKLRKMAKVYKRRVGRKGFIPFPNLISSDKYLPRIHRNPDTGSKLFKLYWAFTHWRTSIPRRGHDEMMKAFAELEKEMVVMQTYAIGGDVKGSAPLAPTSFFKGGPLRMLDSCFSLMQSLLPFF